jgi:hypothetical protein
VDGTGRSRDRCDSRRGGRNPGARGVRGEVKAWQWDLANLRVRSGFAPVTVPCVTRGQNGPVWFLGEDGYLSSVSLTQTCAVPDGRYVFLNLPSHDCSTVERAPFHASTGAGLLACAQSFGAPTSSLAVDGKVISPAGFELTTPVFSFTMPALQNWLEVPGKTADRAAVAGQGIMLGPLTPGTHTIVRVWQDPRAPIWVRTYRLTVH